MSNHTPEATQFYFTAAAPCPYLPERLERKLFTHLSGRRARILHQLLGQHGFRRSQAITYRPACEGCAACRSVRVVANEFRSAARHKRVKKANRDVTAVTMPPNATREQYDLFTRYLEARHADGGMAAMSFIDYALMIEDTPVETVLIEYRLTGEPDHKTTGRLVAVTLTDLMEDGLSMVYSFFDPGLGQRGLGNLMILDHIDRALETGLSFVYLGYWVEQSPKMAYKASFKPIEAENGDMNWQRLEGA